MNVVEYCASEVERQSGTPMEVYGMYRAYKYLCRQSFTEVTEAAIVRLHECVKRTSIAESGYRKVPAVFNQGSPALEASLIPRAMEVLVASQSGMTAHLFCNEFLMIHPFSDGNGRVASLLYNFKQGTLQRPVPLPSWPELQAAWRFSYS